MEQLTGENLKDYMGKYVEYGIDLNNDGDYTNDWKLFYVGEYSGEESRIYLISADYVLQESENGTNISNGILRI